MKEFCFECNRPAQHKHHVVPKVLGGTRTLPMCEECHSKVHGTNLALSNLRRVGIAKAIKRYKAEGKKWGGGGWNKLDESKYGEIQDLRNQGLSLRAIGVRFGVTAQTILNILNRIQQSRSEV